MLAERAEPHTFQPEARAGATKFPTVARQPATSPRVTMVSALGLLSLILSSSLSIVHAAVHDGQQLDMVRRLVPVVARQEEAAPFSLSISWQVLGPFQIGTRGMPHREFRQCLSLRN